MDNMQMQQRIEKFWDNDASRYSESIQKEMAGFKKDAWTRLIDEHRPAGNTLKALDIGTGPGFFTIILSAMGHQVTAIDCSDKMLLEAGQNLRAAGFTAEFQKMDSHFLSFADQTFDLLLCRNHTWILQNPLSAYKEWHRVLKPGGRLLIFDANWNLRMHDPEMQKKYEEDRERARVLGISRPGHVNKEEGERIAKELYFSKRLRPQWDAVALMDCGFGKLFIDRDITGRVWDEEEKILYRSTPMFLISAEK